jgi:hypothetical protein
VPTVSPTRISMIEDSNDPLAVAAAIAAPYALLDS